MLEQDPMIEVFIYENQQLLQTLEDILLQGEKQRSLTDEQVNEIFRIMHTIKGSSSMMSYDSLTKLSHAVEDLFAQIREKKARSKDWDDIFDIVLAASDLIKADIDKIQAGQQPDSKSDKLIERIHAYLGLISKRKPKPVESPAADAESEDEDEGADDPDALFYKIKVNFSPDAQMENMRAFTVVHALTPFCLRIDHIPEDLMISETADDIVKNGFAVYILSSENPDALKTVIDDVPFVQNSTIINIPEDSDEIPVKIRRHKHVAADETAGVASPASPESALKQNFLSVNVNKIDKLMDLVGEIVTTESMVTKNFEVNAANADSFDRAGQQLKKLIKELQEVVTSIRMVPISTTFHKMQRIVRDMCKKIDKDVDLAIDGEETELDKSIVDSLSDPLMHLVRNAVDHGIEMTDVRIKNGKPAKGTVSLEASNISGDAVIITVKDDGGGLDRSRIVQKAIDKGLTTKTDAELSDKEAYALIFAPGFSTNDEVTEFSGRGVGMDVVKRNIDKVGGAISIDSTPGAGTTVQIRIPLSLAIVNGMKLRVGDLIFIVPVLSITTSFKSDTGEVFRDPDGREMIMIRGDLYPIMRLHRILGITPECENLEDGILVMINTLTSTYCLYVDELIGEQQAVTKPLPDYIQAHNRRYHDISGCAILGDGSISLIIDINNLISSD